jgi:hypothetical protein
MSPTTGTPLPSLLVPVALDVLAYRTATGAATWASTTSTCSSKELISPQPFALRTEDRPLGAYLHWAMPDGLTIGTQEQPGDDPADAPAVVFPALPDCWVVVRVAPAPGTGAGAQGSPRRTTAWVLSSAGAPAFPADGAAAAANQPEGPTRINAVPADEWAPACPGAEPPMTAVGPGDLSWAAYYDNVVNRFGFWDGLVDNGTPVVGPVSYLVCGWYQDRTQDPLAKVGSADSFHQVLARLGWQLADASPTDKADWARQSLFHGSAVSIAWPGTTWDGDLDGQLSAEEVLQPQASAVVLSLGRTTAEAISTLATGWSGPATATSSAQALLLQLQNLADGPDGACRLADALHAAAFGATAPPAATSTVVDTGSGQLVSVQRAAPRYFQPTDPVLVLRGAGRSDKHGGSGRFDAEGLLRCRLSGQVVSSLGPGANGQPLRVEYPHLQRECFPRDVRALFRELVYLDPCLAGVPVAGQQSAPSLVRTGWWASWDPTTPPPLLQPVGLLPSPVAVTPPTRPWNPLHLDWEVSWQSLATATGTWSLAQGELVPDGPPVPAGPPVIVAGRTMLTSGPAIIVGGALAAAQSTAYNDTWAMADLLAATIAPGPNTVPGPGNSSLRAGNMQLTRARVVDTYGQHLDLIGTSSPGSTVLVPPVLEEGAGAVTLTLPPRLAYSARALFRYVAADGRTGPDGLPLPADDLVSPVCGFLIADVADGSLEMASSSGAPVGRLVSDAASGTSWQEPLGRPGGVSAFPDASIAACPGADVAAWRPMAQLAEAVLSLDRDRPASSARGASGAAAASGDSTKGATGDMTALSSLVGTLDQARSSVALTSDVGDEHLAVLLFSPTAVLRATLTVQVDLPPGIEVAPGTPVEVQLGDLDRLEDGLLGYFVDDDYTRLKMVPSSSAAPPVIRPGGVAFLDCRPLYVPVGQSVDLTLLVEPGCDVHLTTGLLPTKSVGMRRSWVAPGLQKLTPSLPYGPLLVDAVQPVLPLPTDVPGTWLRHYRRSPDTWASDAPTPGSVLASVPARPPVVSEGWLRVAPGPDNP